MQYREHVTDSTGEVVGEKMQVAGARRIAGG
jgi:hypothetical protein